LLCAPVAFSDLPRLSRQCLLTFRGLHSLAVCCVAPLAVGRASSLRSDVAFTTLISHDCTRIFARVRVLSWVALDMPLVLHATRGTHGSTPSLCATCLREHSDMLRQTLRRSTHRCCALRVSYALRHSTLCVPSLDRRTMFVTRLAATPLDAVARRSLRHAFDTTRLTRCKRLNVSCCAATLVPHRYKHPSLPVLPCRGIHSRYRDSPLFIAYKPPAAFNAEQLYLRQQPILPFVNSRSPL